MLFLFRSVSKLWKEIIDEINKDYIHVLFVRHGGTDKTIKVEKDFPIRKLIFRISVIMHFPPYKIKIETENPNLYLDTKSKEFCRILQEEKYGLNRIKMVWTTMPACHKGIRLGTSYVEDCENAV